MKKLFTVFLVLLIAISVFASGSSESSKAKDPIKIGCIQDTTGGASSAGQPNEWGVQYAVEVLNANGGINGRLVELYCRDCQNNVEVGITCYRELVDEIGVCAIVGPPLSNPAAAWVDLATEDKIPIVGHFMDEICTTNPDTGKVYPYMFLAEPGCAVQGYTIAAYAMDELGVKSVATLYNPGNAFAKQQEIPFVNYVKDHNGKVLAEEIFGWTDADYSAQAIKIAKLNPDAVYLSDYAAQAKIAYDALRDAGYEGYILGANTLSETFRGMTKNKVYKTYYVQNYDLNNGKAKELTDMHMKRTGTQFPVANVCFGWDAANTLFNAMKQANNPEDGEEVAKILENNTKNLQLSTEVNLTIVPSTHRPTADMGMWIATNDDKDVTIYVKYVTTTYGSVQ